MRDGDQPTTTVTSARPALVCLAATGAWWLFSPCEYCGGTRLPLCARPTGAVEIAALAARLAPRGCARCETARRRGQQSDATPAVWFDTLAGDWVVALPDRRGRAAILPLEIRWYDAREAVVYRAASDLAYCGDELGPWGGRH
ncbi:MAG: hypothetical protein ABSH51_21285 [Solirubrobacteraceae bacterium]